MIVDWYDEISYRQGYERALLDVKEWFENHSLSLNLCKMYNRKNIEMILSAMSSSAESMIEYGDDTDVFFKFNGKNKVTEVYIKKECEDERFRKNDD